LSKSAQIRVREAFSQASKESRESREQSLYPIGNRIAVPTTLVDNPGQSIMGYSRCLTNPQHQQLSHQESCLKLWRLQALKSAIDVSGTQPPSWPLGIRPGVTCPVSLFLCNLGTTTERSSWHQSDTQISVMIRENFKSPHWVGQPWCLTGCMQLRAQVCGSPWIRGRSGD
jgi:hypothetical protein